MGRRPGSAVPLPPPLSKPPQPPARRGGAPPPSSNGTALLSRPSPREEAGARICHRLRRGLPRPCRRTQRMVYRTLHARLGPGLNDPSTSERVHPKSFASPSVAPF